jgi:hypothetical protein
MASMKAALAAFNASVRIGPDDTQFKVQVNFQGNRFARAPVKSSTIALLPYKIISK